MVRGERGGGGRMDGDGGLVLGWVDGLTAGGKRNVRAGEWGSKLTCSRL